MALKTHEEGQLPDDARLFHYNPRMFGDELKGWRACKVALLDALPRPLGRAYFWESTADTASLLRVELHERHDWREARARFEHERANTMRIPAPLSSADAAALHADVADIVRDPRSDLCGAASFVQGNVFVSIRNAGERISDVAEASLAVSRMLAAKANAVVNRHTQSVRQVAVRARELVPIVLIDGLERLPDDTSMRVIAQDGELRLERDALVYTPSSAGKKSVQVIVLR